MLFIAQNRFFIEHELAAVKTSTTFEKVHPSFEILFIVCWCVLSSGSKPYRYMLHVTSKILYLQFFHRMYVHKFIFLFLFETNFVFVHSGGNLARVHLP